GLAVMSIDLDGFKTINDSLGHPAGDELLVRIANRLVMHLRTCDTIGRLGGDEFLVLMPQIDDASTVAVMARDLLVAVSQPVPLESGHEAYVTASIGVSLYPADGSTTAVEMLRDADAALFRAKESG